MRVYTKEDSATLNRLVEENVKLIAEVKTLNKTNSVLIKCLDVYLKDEISLKGAFEIKEWENK